MRWFRFYAEALHDVKVQALSDRLFKVWVNLLCFSAEHDGLLPDARTVAFALRVAEKQAQNYLTALEDAGLLDVVQDGYRPHNWDARQFASDNVTERVRKHRSNVSGNVTKPLHETPPDTDTETEQKQRQNRTEGGAEAERARPFVLYEQALGQPVPNRIVADRLIFLESEFGLECLEHCLEAAAIAEAYDIRYVEKILKRHQRDGCEDRPIANSAAPADLAFFEKRYAQVKGVTG